MKNFISVSTNAARFQDISLNPQKLAGMCAKLKCCLNYEVDSYIEAGKKLPSKEVVLQTQDNDYYLFKSDIMAGMITYSTDKRIAANLETISAARAKDIIEMNRRGEKPLTLQGEGKVETNVNGTVDLLQGDISRFDKAKKKKKKQGGNGHKNNQNEVTQQAQQNENASKANNANATQNENAGQGEVSNNQNRQHKHKNKRNNHRQHKNGQQQNNNAQEQ